MFAILLCWLFLSVICYLWGEISVALFAKLTGKKESYSIVESFTIGVCTVGTFVGFTSLSAPSGMIIMIALGIIPALYFVVKRGQEYEMIGMLLNKWKSFTKTQIAYAIAILAFFFLFVTMPPQLPDTYTHLIQNMMWNEEFAVIPGVANLNYHFAFNSNFLLLSTVFGLKPLFGQYIFGINAFYMALIFIYIMSNMAKRRTLPAVILSLIVFIVLFIQYKTHIASPSTDLFPNLLIVFLMLAMFSNQNSLQEKSLLFWIVPVFCLTLKLPMIFICLLSVYLLFWLMKIKAYRAIYFLSVWSFLIIVPWLVRNILISGYLVYPFPEIDLFNVDWKVPIETAIIERDNIKASAILPAAYNNPQMVAGWSLEKKLHEWLLNLPPLSIGIIFTTLISPLLMFLAFWRDKYKHLKRHAGLYLMWAFVFLASIFSICIAPQISFSFGLLVVASFMPFYLLIRNIKVKHSRTNTVLSILVVIIFLGIETIRYFNKLKDPHIPYSYILYLPQDIESTEYKRKQRIIPRKIDGEMMNVAEEGFCVDCPLPCIRKSVNIEMRGNTLQDGFKPKRKRY